VNYDWQTSREIGSGCFGEYVALDVVGCSSGVIVGWKEDVFSLGDSNWGSLWSRFN
jgi:hypothetical protein